MPFTIRKSLIIGLGGTGRDAVLNAKACCNEVYGEVPPTTRFYVIDTTDPEPLEGKPGVRTTLERGEFRKLIVRDPGTLIRENPEVKCWFPADVPQRAITNGAGQIRALGRLALYSDPRIRGALRTLINDVNAWDVQRLAQESPKYELFDGGATLYVTLVTSLAGGTGSGTFLDIAFLLKELLQSTDKMTGYLLLPDVFQSKPATRNVAPNAYAALKEVNHYMGLKSNVDEAFVFGGHPVTREVPFDFVYAINNVTSDGTVYSDANHLEELLGRGIFMSFGASGKHVSDIWDNLANQLTGQKKMNGKTAFLSSFGLSELVYDPDRFVSRYVGELGVGLVRKILLGEQVDAKNAVEEFLKKTEMREDGEHYNEVIDSLVKHREPNPFDRPQKAEKRSIERMLEDRPGYLQHMRDRVNRETDLTVKTVSDRVGASLTELIRAELHKENGLSFCRSFLLELRGRLESVEREMVTENEEFATNLRLEEEICREIQDDKNHVAGLFKGSVWEDLAQRLQTCIVGQAKCELEMTRRSKAAHLFQMLISLISKELERLDRLRSLAEALVSDLSRELEAISREAPKREPFVKVFEPPQQKHDADGVQIDDFLKWLVPRGTSISNFPDMQLQEVKKLLHDYAKGLNAVRDARERSIEDVLRDLPKKERFEQVSILGRMAEPLWSYNKARTTGDHSTEQMFLVGTENDDDTILSDPELDAHLAVGPYPPQVVATGDKYRITCLKIEAAIPPFILDGISRYRDRYKDPDRPFTYHTDDKFEDSTDLFPISDEEEQRKWWALALSDPFNLIERRGEHYYFRSEKLGRKTEDYLVKLDQGRTESMKKFLKNKKMIEETETVVEKVLRDNGSKNVQDSMMAWLHKKEEEYRGTRMTARIRDLVEMELSEVERWIAETLEELR